MVTEVIHEQAAPNANTSGMALMVGIAIVILAVIAFMYFVGFGGFRLGYTTPSVSIPDKVDVNVNQPK